MKTNREKMREGGESEESICRVIPQQNLLLENDEGICNASDKKRRRMSKKERKVMKQMNLRKKTKLEEASIKLNSTEEIRGEEEIEEQEERTRLECMKTYRAIDIPQKPSIDLFSQFRNSNGINMHTESVGTEGRCRTLGKWFPAAIVMKTTSYTNTGQLISNSSKNDLTVENPRSSLVLFYQYATSASEHAIDKRKGARNWDRQQLQLLMTYLYSIARRRNIGGRIRVAPEGVNATLSAVDNRMCTAQSALRHLAEDLHRFDERVFSRTDFKFLDDLPADRHFKEFKIFPVKELVYYDIGEDDAPLNLSNTNGIGGVNKKETRGNGGGYHLDAKEYHKMLQKDNTVVIDVRNHYETILGRFDGQQKQDQSKQIGLGSKSSVDILPSSSGGCAEYIDPKMRKSTDFKAWLATPETQQKLQKKTVLMYCTGGIRCERASAYLKSQMGDQLEGVYQLKGGIERYLKTFKDGGFWRGKNFVFDKREAVSVENPHGDGGVLRKAKKKSEKKKIQEQNKDKNSILLAKCCVCGDQWDRYVGKKKCLTCGVPVLMCDKCMSLKPDKTAGLELRVRCPLCVEQSITVLAKEVQLTANGIKNKTVPASVTTAVVSTRNEEKDFVGPYRDWRSNRSKVTGIEVKANELMCQTSKAAKSVLKWGGGYATKKKKLKKADRKNGFVHHPERMSGKEKSTQANRNHSM